MKLTCWIHVLETLVDSTQSLEKKTNDRIQKHVMWAQSKTEINTNFDVLLTVHLSIFISVFNQLDAQNLFHNKFYFMTLHVSSACAHHHVMQF